ncbi:MAG: hypothetical protein JSW06_06005 [Thermoplasmatales archaeon]|nr:MAG: hypothetical protein JSW06_06005 [Thermoplasmatales archaeon]
MFVKLPLYAISLFMAAAALLIEIAELDKTIDAELFLGIGLILIIIIGLINTMNKNK